MENAPALMGDLMEQIARGEVLVVVGAGIAIAASGGAASSSWTGLLRDGVERCMQVVQPPPSARWREIALAEIESGDTDLLLSAAEKVTSKLEGPKGPEFGRWLRETVGALGVRDRAAIEAIAALGVPVATTNYDGLLEEVLGLQAVSSRDPSDVERVLRGGESGVIHLHGWWKHPETVVLGIRSYDAQLANEHAQAVLRALMMTRTLLFVGFGTGLDDPNFSALADWAAGALQGSAYRRFRLVKDDEVAAAQASRRRDPRMFTLGYGPSHGDLPRFLRSLARLAPRTDPTSAPPPPSAARLHPSGDVLALTELITQVQSKRVPLSQTLAEALSLAQRIGAAELEAFCRGELGGWELGPEDMEVINGRLAYRNVKAFVCLDPIDVDYFAHRGGETAIFRFMESEPRKFFPRTLFIHNPVIWIESRAKQSTAPTAILQLTMPASWLVPTTKVGSVYAYAASDAVINMLDDVRIQFTRRLLAALPAAG